MTNEKIIQDFCPKTNPPINLNITRKMNIIQPIADRVAQNLEIISKTF